MKMTSVDCDFNVSDFDPNAAYLEGTDISYSFYGKTTTLALKKIRFKMDNGSINAIIGESGSGKSTLLKIIYGLLEPESGKVRFKGHRILGPKEKLIPGHESMRLVSQNFDDLNLYASVWENVSAELSNSDLAIKNRKTKNILNRLRINHLKDQRIFDLSGGEKQRVAIAKALINNPLVLLMDEPFNQVDASFRELLQEDIRQIVQDTNLTIVLVSHDPAEVLSLADKLFVLKGGRVIASGEPNMLFNKPTNSYTARLLAKANVLNQQDASYLSINTNKKIIIHPHHITIEESLQSLFFLKQIRFKGFYQEMIIGAHHDPAWELQAIQVGISPLVINKNVNLVVEKYLEVNQ